MTNNAFFCMAAACVIMSSCTKDYYDKDRYEEIITTNFPVANVDVTHNWSSLSECTADIAVDMAEGKTYTVKVYENDPMDGYTGYVLTQGQVENGHPFVSNFSYPAISTTVFVAFYDEETGITYSRPANVEQGRLKLSISSQTLSAMTTTQRQIVDNGFEMAYCFEDSYPQSGDYDFNDVVISTNLIKNIGMERTTLSIGLRLRAVGSTKVMAAALHMAGLSAADVESVVCEGPLFKYNPLDGIGNYEGNDKKKVFPSEQPAGGYLESSLQTGIYIPLTNDVHCSINRGAVTSTGALERMNYNTMLASQMPDVTDKSQPNLLPGRDVSPVEGKIIITMKSGAGDKNITMKNFDMFILEEYNGAIWEVHTFAYKTRPVVTAYGTYEDNVYPWALAVPGSRFHWPAEGKVIGGYRTSSVFEGAYQSIGHSFGQWAVNRNISKDWYLHPTIDMVY